MLNFDYNPHGTVCHSSSKGYDGCRPLKEVEGSDFDVEGLTGAEEGIVLSRLSLNRPKSDEAHGVLMYASCQWESDNDSRH